MSRTKNRSSRRHNQLIIKHHDGSETAVTPMKAWTPSGQKGPIEPEYRPDVIRAIREAETIANQPPALGAEGERTG